MFDPVQGRFWYSLGPERIVDGEPEGDIAYEFFDVDKVVDSGVCETYGEVFEKFDALCKKHLN